MFFDSAAAYGSEISNAIISGGKDLKAETKRNLKFILLATLTLIVLILVFVQRESPILRNLTDRKSVV